MSKDILNIFARHADLAGVARRLRELHPSVQIDGPDHDWRTATLTFGRLWTKRKLVFNYDPRYHAEPNWSRQMSGMSGYLARFPETSRKGVAVGLPSTFHFTLPAILEPGLSRGVDPRLDVITAVARHLDGILFTPAALLDADGRILFGAGGEVEEDPRATWPLVLAETASGWRAVEYEPRDGEDEEDELDPPSAERVARRALALAAVTARAQLEEDADAPEAAELHRDLLEWVREIGIEDELEGPDPWRPDRPHERSVVETPPGALAEQAQVDAWWRAEGMAVLAWALGLAELPDHDQPADAQAIRDALGYLEPYKARGLLASPELRPREEIAALRRRLFALHWRARDFTLNPRRMDFAGFARTAWFGPLDITGLPLAEGDLALRGVPIDRAHPDLVANVRSAAQERHQAVNWLCDGPERYSEADAST